MRRVTVSGGFTGVIIADLADTLAELDQSTYKMALVPEGDPEPPVGDPAWVTPTGTLFPSAATLAMLVTEATPHPAHYHVAVDIVSASGRHEVSWQMDEEKPTQRALVYIV